MALTNQKKHDFIVNAKSYIDNAVSDDYIRERILSIGYDENRLNEGLAMQEKARESRERQLAAMNKAKALHTKLKETYKVNHDIYISDARLLRSTFHRNIPVKEKLGLYGRNKRSVTGYIERARTFYNTILKEKDILDQLAQFNITAETIQEKLAGVAEVEKAYITFIDADRAAQDATDENDKELMKLRDWIRIFQDACRIVLRGKPQLKEKVGILVRSSKPPKKKKEENSADNTENNETVPENAAGENEAA